MQTIDFQTLTRSVQERFVSSVRGRVEPAPLAQAPLRLREPWIWSAVIVLSLLALVGLAAHSFGDLGRDDALQGTGAMVADALLVAAIALGGIRLALLSAERRALPYPRGVYAYPVSVIDARTDALHVYHLTEATGVEGPDADGRLVVSFANERFAFTHAERDAAQKLRDMFAGKADSGPTSRDSDPRVTLMYSLDPLQRPRVSTPLGPKDSLFRPVPGWLRQAWLLAPVAGLLLGPALRTARNAASDRRMYDRAASADTPAAWRSYMARGGRRSDEVARALLPRAELHEAEHAGTVEAIDAFVAAHPGTAIADETADARRRALLDDLARAKKVGTLFALQDFAKRHPDSKLEPELRDSIHALFAPALETFRTHAPTDPAAKAIVERLFAYSEAKAQAGSTDTTVQIRFRRRPTKSLWKADKMVSEHHWFIGEASYPSRYFDVAHAAPREAAQAKTLGRAFGDAFGPTVFDFQLGPRLDDAQEELPKVDVPTVVIVHGEEWPRTFDGSITKPRGIWVDVAFDFEVTWLIPGAPPSAPFHLESVQKIPPQVIKDNPDGGTAQSPLEEKIYGGEADQAFAELQTKYLEVFVPPKSTAGLGGGPSAGK
ncbi:MAG: hypothetical protein NVS3B10_06900 [Polyangiales bacterium]